jgi:hypothetical protein
MEEKFQMFRRNLMPSSSGSRGTAIAANTPMPQLRR